ncbi:MAG: hypothetical protein M3304_03770 [Actinomycetota bacterium]|nr:hypothetical protein [Actinomycetota bacterium]
MEALSATESAHADGLRWIEAENLSHFAAAEAVAQAGAGGLLLSVDVAELFLGVWSAGWWQRSGVVVLAAVGLALVARAIAPLFARDLASSGRRTERSDEPIVGPIAARDGACAY